MASILVAMKMRHQTIFETSALRPKTFHEDFMNTPLGQAKVKLWVPASDEKHDRRQAAP